MIASINTDHHFSNTPSEAFNTLGLRWRLLMNVNATDSNTLPSVKQPRLAHFEREMRICIENCIRCHQISLSTLQHCIEMGGKHADPKHLLLMQDCASICATSADFMLRGSNFHELTCQACAEVCAACADECATFENDAMMQECAEACRACALSCKAMSASQNEKRGH